MRQKVCKKSIWLSRVFLALIDVSISTVFFVVDFHRIFQCFFYSRSVNSKSSLQLNTRLVGYKGAHTPRGQHSTKKYLSYLQQRATTRALSWARHGNVDYFPPHSAPYILMVYACYSRRCCCSRPIIESSSAIVRRVRRAQWETWNLFLRHKFNAYGDVIYLDTITKSRFLCLTKLVTISLWLCSSPSNEYVRLCLIWSFFLLFIIVAGFHCRCSFHAALWELLIDRFMLPTLHSWEKSISWLLGCCSLCNESRKTMKNSVNTIGRGWTIGREDRALRSTSC